MGNTLTFGIAIYLLAFIVPLIKNNTFEKKYIALFLSLTVFDAFVNLGYVIKLNSFILEYNILTSIILFIPSTYIFLTKKINRSTLHWFSILTICIVIGALKSILTKQQVLGVGYQENWDDYFAIGKSISFVSFNLRQFINMFGRFIITFVNVSAFFSIFNQHHLKILTKTIRTYTVMSLILYIIEFYMYNIANDITFREKIVKLFGETEDLYLVPRLFLNKISNPLLLLKEPSAVGFTLFIASCNEIFIFNYKNKKSSLFMLFFLVILMVLTSAMTTIIYLVILMISFLSSLFKKKRYIFIISILAFILLVPAVTTIYSHELSEFLANYKSFKYGIPSFTSINAKVIRTYSIYIAIQQLLKNPIFGIGLGTSYAHSGIFTMLSNIGITGTISFLMMTSTYHLNFKFKKSSKLLSIFFLCIMYSLSGHLSMLLYIQYTQIALFLLTASNKCEKNNLIFTEKEKEIILYKNILQAI